MAVLDDQTWLLAFIRNQFIISDDTGICETVLGPELEPKEYESVPSSSFLGASTSSQNHNNGEKRLRERALSPDIVLEVDSRVSRRRSNTAVRLEKIRKERDEKGRVTTVRWRARPAGTPRRSAMLQTQQSVEELNAAFAQVEVKRQNSSVQRPKSLLSATLEADEARGSRQRFEEYAKFDGYMQRNGKTFMVYIHLPDTPGETPPALSVCVLENTKFSDLIGLVCLRWTQANGEPALKDDVAHYTLLFAEDNGDIDRDIPSIELSEPVGKYGASALAFVENDDPTARGAAERVVVKVNLVEGSFSKFVFDTADIPLGAVLEKVLRKRKMIPKVRGLEYTLEKAGHPGIALDLNQTLSSVRVREFWMVRINSKNPSTYTTLSGIGGIV
ncbi:putative Target of rapamycin complex 2 subunit MAPKAP1 [Hypsibius exemplaris]|uniref:Target of rapamycin complex 2 subunit MAPKAP1 n=1 Tax=Hypsibius exemplaris TaxID=2072580 RepID=A0A1W0WY51_HYPEX|nr:putative Target of rapamycin complex 2 subunit MAPKAP1 [Hypsibius exemplaris]